MARRLGLEFLFTVLLLPQAAAAQSLGIFSWQLAPFCNVVSVEVTQSGSV